MVLSQGGVTDTTVARRNEYGGATTCLRCGGLMVSELGFDLVVQRCLQCGERIDPVILQNRQHPGAYDR